MGAKCGVLFSYLCGGLPFIRSPLPPRIGKPLLLELVLDSIRTRRKSEDGKTAYVCLSSKALQESLIVLGKNEACKREVVDSRGSKTLKNGWYLYTKVAHMAARIEEEKASGLTMAVTLWEHREWQACLWGTQNALARLSRHVGRGKTREYKLNKMECVFIYLTFIQMFCSMSTELLVHAACVLLFSVQGEMDLT